MAAPKKETKEEKRRPPARTPEARNNQLISLAIDLAEKQLSDGTASSQVISHYIKMASAREQLELERLKEENKLLRAKTEAVQSAKKVEELYKNALNAMRTYSGQGGSDDEEDD